MSKNAVTTTKKNLPATNEMFNEFERDQSAGFENVTSKDMALPFIQVIQSNSPQVIAGTAKPGEFWHVVKKISLGKEIKVIPVNFQKVYIEWQAREAGGGFVQYHFDEKILEQAPRNDMNRNVLPNGNYIQTTAYHFCLLLVDGVPEPVIISLASTQLKNSRKWLAVARGLKLKVNDNIITPPMYAYEYTINTVVESNSKGSWFGYNIFSPVQLTDISLYQLARAFYTETSSDIEKVLPAAPIDDEETAEKTEAELANETDEF